MRALPLAPVIFANNRSGRGYLGYNGGRSPPPPGSLCWCGNAVAQAGPRFAEGFVQRACLDLDCFRPSSFGVVSSPRAFFLSSPVFRRWQILRRLVCCPRHPPTFLLPGTVFCSPILRAPTPSYSLLISPTHRVLTNPPTFVPVPQPSAAFGARVPPRGARGCPGAYGSRRRYPVAGNKSS